MANFNKCILIGNLVRDPELKYSSKGTAIAKITLAINRNWKGENGEKKEECTFVEVDVFGRQAETIAQYCKKGSPLMVEGRLKLDQWDDKQSGQKRSRLGVVLEGFQFLGKGDGDSTGNAPAAKPANTEAATSTDAPPPEDDDVPF